MRQLIVTITLSLATLPLLARAAPDAAADCPELLRHDVRILRSKETANLCKRYAGHPVLVVNTASHCGFTPQFEGLEALFQRYRDRGLRVAGFPSDDFRQEADDEAKTAEICYVNYGVTFDMYGETRVRGDAAHPLFKGLAARSSAPKWNFYKYLIDREGQVVESFSSMTAPDSEALVEAIERVL